MNSKISILDQVRWLTHYQRNIYHTVFLFLRIICVDYLFYSRHMSFFIIPDFRHFSGFYAFFHKLQLSPILSDLSQTCIFCLLQACLNRISLSYIPPRGEVHLYQLMVYYVCLCMFLMGRPTNCEGLDRVATILTA